MNELMDGLKVTTAIPKTYEWYEFRQNNSGGSFRMNENVTVHVLIQADSTKNANAKAEEVGIYFNGCRAGRDCDCCGDRWYEAGDAMESFTTYEWKNNWTPVEYANAREYAQAVADNDTWANKDNPTVILYYANGTVERFYKKDK